LHGELAARGVRLSYATVRRSLTKRLGRAGQTRSRVNAAKPKPVPPPSPKHLSFDWVRRPEKRTVEAQARLDKIRTARPDLMMALDLADEFAALIRKQSTGTLADWLSRAEVSPCPEVRNFAEGIRRDESAVNAAATMQWSNGPVEGHVNRLKIVATDYPDCHSPSLAGYTTGRAVDGVPQAGRLGPPTPTGRTGRIPMPRPHSPQRPPAH
jgi:transposase